MDRTTQGQSYAAAAAAGTPPPGRRIEAVDFARGIAVSRMILSRGANGLLPLHAFRSWGLVPVYAIALLWIPFVLPLWRGCRWPRAGRAQ